MTIHIRWLIRRDKPAVLAIEQSLDAPWDEAEWLQALEPRNVIGMVAEIGETVVGAFAYSLERDHLELIRLLVHPDHRGEGIGRAICAKLRSKLNNNEQRSRCVVEIADEDLDLHLFLRATGWEATHVLRGEPDLYHFVLWAPVPEKATIYF